MKGLSFLSVALVGVMLIGCQTTDTVRIDNIPMYGQPEVVRPASLRQADEDFVKEAMKGFSSRREASTAWWRQGTRHVRNGNLDYAMRRHNQAWLLDPDNYQPYWGFGMVYLNQENTADAIRYLERALSLVDDDKQKVHLLGDLGITYAVHGLFFTDENDLVRAAANFKQANKHFIEAARIEPGYGRTFREWAWTLFEEGRYADAWTKVNQARKLNAKPFSPEFLSDLSAKMPEPR